MVDTATVGALSRTSVSIPSGYAIFLGQTVRTEEGTHFDFAYDVDGTGRAVFIPSGVFGLLDDGEIEPGFQASEAPFDDITVAPSEGYLGGSATELHEGLRLLARSGNLCSEPGVPWYAKLEVLDIDSTAFTVQFQVLTNANCGYRSLEPGVPYH